MVWAGEHGEHVEAAEDIELTLAEHFDLAGQALIGGRLVGTDFEDAVGRLFRPRAEVSPRGTTERR